MDELDGSEYCKQCGLKKEAQNGSTRALETQGRSRPIGAAGASRARPHAVDSRVQM